MIVECQNCQASVDAEEAGGYEYPCSEGRPPGRYLLLKCQRCAKPILVTENNVGNMVEGDVWDTPVRIYPADDLYVSSSVPRPIRNAYEEAALSFRARAYTAAAIMCRKTLEGICHSQSIKENSLAASLRQMKDQKLIDDRLFEWSDALRLAGNEAAHDVTVTVSQEDARNMLEFASAIVEYVFAFREKFEQFKERQQRRSERTDSGPKG